MYLTVPNIGEEFKNLSARKEYISLKFTILGMNSRTEFLYSVGKTTFFLRTASIRIMKEELEPTLSCESKLTVDVKSIMQQHKRLKICYNCKSSNNPNPNRRYPTYQISACLVVSTATKILHVLFV
jgi:hypothetical protein